MDPVHNVSDKCLTSQSSVDAVSDNAIGIEQSGADNSRCDAFSSVQFVVPEREARDDEIVGIYSDTSVDAVTSDIISVDTVSDNAIGIEQSGADNSRCDAFSSVQFVVPEREARDDEIVGIYSGTSVDAVTSDIISVDAVSNNAIGIEQSGADNSSGDASSVAEVMSDREVRGDEIANGGVQANPYDFDVVGMANYFRREGLMAATETERSKKRKRPESLSADVDDLMQDVAETAAKMCRGLRSKSCSNRKRPGGTLCDAHSKEKFFSTTWGKYKFNSLSSFRDHLCRVGNLQAVKLNKSEGEEARVEIGVDSPTSRGYWIDTRENCCGEEFVSRCLTLLTEIVFAAGHLSCPEIEFLSYGRVEIDLLKIFRGGLQSNYSKQINSAVFQIVSVSLARATDLAKYVWRKKDAIRPLKCYFQIDIPSRQVARYMSSLKCSNGGLLPLPAADCITNCLLSIRTPLRGDLHVRGMRLPPLSDCIENQLAVLPDFFCSLHDVDECGRMRCNAVRLHLMSQLQCVGSVCNWREHCLDVSVSNGTSFVTSSDLYLEMSSAPDTGAVVEEEEADPTVYTPRRISTRRSNSFGSPNEVLGVSDSPRRRLEFLKSTISECSVSLCFIVCPSTLGSSAAFKLNAASYATILFGALKDEWIQIRNDAIEKGYDFDAALVPNEKYAMFREMMGEGGAKTETEKGLLAAMLK